jgi:hypothetical protein
MMNELDSSEDWRGNPAVKQAAWDGVKPAVRSAIMRWMSREWSAHLEASYRDNADIYARVARAANALAFEIGFENAPDRRNVERIRNRLFRLLLKCFKERPHQLPQWPVKPPSQIGPPLTYWLGLTSADMMPARKATPTLIAKWRRTQEKYDRMTFEGQMTERFPPETWLLDSSRFSTLATNYRRVASECWKHADLEKKKQRKWGLAQSNPIGRRADMGRRNLLRVASKNGLSKAELARQIAGMGYSANNARAPSPWQTTEPGKWKMGDADKYHFRTEAQYTKAWDEWVRNESPKFQKAFRDTKRLGRKRK